MTKGVIGIQRDSRVMLRYTLSLADGHVVEATGAQPPATHIMGSGDWLPVLEDRLLGLCAGDKRHFEISAVEVGLPETSESQVMPRDEFPPELTLEAGQVIGFSMPSGEEIPGTVLEVSEHEVTVDFTHPLAGHDLVWEVEILEVIPPKTG